MHLDQNWTLLNFSHLGFNDVENQDVPLDVKFLLLFLQDLTFLIFKHLPTTANDNQNSQKKN